MALSEAQQQAEHFWGFFFNSGSPVEALMVMLAVPFSLVGAFWLLWLLGYNDQLGNRGGDHAADHGASDPR